MVVQLLNAVVSQVARVIGDVVAIIAVEDVIAAIALEMIGAICAMVDVVELRTAGKFLRGATACGGRDPADDDAFSLCDGRGIELVLKEINCDELQLVCQPCQVGVGEGEVSAGRGDTPIDSDLTWKAVARRPIAELIGQIVFAGQIPDFKAADLCISLEGL